MEDAIADGQLDQILREINPDTTLTATVAPSDEQGTNAGERGNNVDESQGQGGVTARSSNLPPGGIAGVAILAAGVTAAVVFFIVAGRRRSNDDDHSMRSSLDSSNRRSSSKKGATALHEDASLRRLRAAAAAAGSSERPGVYPDTFHQDAAHMTSTRVINPGLMEDELLSSDDEEPFGAPGSFPTEAPPTPRDKASTPLIPAAAAAGGVALAAQYQGIVQDSSTDRSMLHEDDAQLQDAYDDALDAQIMAATGKINEDADINQILIAIPGSPAGAKPKKNSESPDSSFEDDIRAAITSMEGEDNARDVSPERELPNVDYSSESDPESEKEEDKKEKRVSGISGLIQRLSSKNLGAESED